MGVSIITFANLGKKINIPTADILPVIDSFNRKNELDSVVCGVNTDFYFKNTKQALPKLLRYLVRFLEEVLRHRLPRRSNEKLFDFFASFRIKKKSFIICHGGYFLPKTLKVAKEKKIITVDLARTAHVKTNSDIEKKESEVLGLTNNGGWYTNLVKDSEHLNEFNYIIAMSDFVKRSYEEEGFPEEKIYIAHPDIDKKRFFPAQQKKDKFIVLYIADTQMLKGLHYLLEAWQVLNIENTELWIVGSMTVPDVLKRRYFEIINTHDNIKYFEHSKSPEEYYNKASIFVLPSLTEGFGRVTLEVMACGVPVITTENAKGIVEDGKTGFVVPIRDSKAIAEKIEFLYKNPHIREKMGKEARIAVENKKPFGEAVYEIYLEILKRENRI